MPDDPIEGELQFDFSSALRWKRLDIQGIPAPHGMSLVDFVVDESNRKLLIEVKDPSSSKVPVMERIKYEERLKASLINEELVPKARDSYTFLHLMKEDDNPCLYVVLMGLDSFPNEAALVLGFKDRLLKRIRQEASTPWKRRYVTDCLVLSIKEWNTVFKNYKVLRKP